MAFIDATASVSLETHRQYYLLSFYIDASNNAFNGDLCAHFTRGRFTEDYNGCCFLWQPHAICDQSWLNVDSIALGAICRHFSLAVSLWVSCHGTNLQ